MALISMGNSHAAVEELAGVGVSMLPGDLIQIGTEDSFAAQVWALGMPSLGLLYKHKPKETKNFQQQTVPGWK